MADAVEEFFNTYDPRIASLAGKLRSLVRRVAPDAEEKLHPGWKTVGYGRRKKFCAISPHAAWINLQFHAGAELEDPAGLLSGTGKRMRHVRIDASDALRQASLRELIREAAASAQ